MEELTYKDLSNNELDTLKDMYISSRVNSMSETDLRKFVKEIIIDQIKGTVGNAEEKEAWEQIKMEELTFKDLSKTELDTLKDIYITSRVNTMTESELRKFVKEIIVDQVKGTVGNAEEKEVWEEIKDHFSDDLSKKILEVKEKCNKNTKVEQKSQEEIEFDRRLGLLKQQQEKDSSKDMW